MLNQTYNIPPAIFMISRKTIAETKDDLSESNYYLY